MKNEINSKPLEFDETGQFDFKLSPKTRFIRFFGYRLVFTPSCRPMLFSERNGITKFITIFGYRIKWLTKN